MEKYVRKPVFVKAEQWDESRQTLESIGCGFQAMDGRREMPDLCRNLRIETGNGTVCVRRGDYIVKHEDGSFTVFTEEYFNDNFDFVIQE